MQSNTARKMGPSISGCGNSLRELRCGFQTQYPKVLTLRSFSIGSIGQIAPVHRRRADSELVSLLLRQSSNCIVVKSMRKWTTTTR